MKKILSALALSLLGFSCVAPASAAEGTDMRLYRFDCGTMTLGDLSMMSDAGEYKGRSYDIVISCYLVKHGNDWLLWDTGYPRNFQGGVTQGTLKMNLEKPLVDELATVGVKPADIRYVVLSHAHFDHAGQSNDFPQATLVMQRAEYQVLANRKDAEAHFIQPQLLAAHTDGKQDKLRLLDGDTDLFGDGTVKLYALPGHTPGHHAMELTLPHAGKVVLSGDQWHFTENHERNQVPTFNYDHDQTIASSRRLNDIVTRDHARLILGHEPKDNGALPRPPRYLD
ncbi:N-acyl homoserine lactonase family protein [Massilia sp. TN1-12]|uniref:N-acyl homoserine lactonase family protein n=1 Tax=Massilia paldalensis TaxID=3377675 RepID=UPI00384A97E6